MASDKSLVHGAGLFLQADAVHGAPPDLPAICWDLSSIREMLALYVFDIWNTIGQETMDTFPSLPHGVMKPFISITHSILFFLMTFPPLPNSQIVLINDLVKQHRFYLFVLKCRMTIGLSFHYNPLIWLL